MQAINFINNAKGVTLIELIAVMVIMEGMASVAVKKLDLISSTTSDRALLEVRKELNVRETIIWTKIKWTSAGWTDDATLFMMLDSDMGPNYIWTSGPNAGGCTVKFKCCLFVASMFLTIVGTCFTIPSPIFPLPAIFRKNKMY